MESHKQTKDYFDEISPKYTIQGRKHSYYLKSLFKILKSKVRPNSSVLDVGCGSGDLLNCLNPKVGVGIDLSEGMLKIARKRLKSKNFIFYKGAAESFELPQKLNFDYILLVDVLEHVKDIEKTVKNIKRYCSKNTVFYIWVTNHTMSWVSEVAQLLKIKEEGPHKWPRKAQIRKILKKQGLNFEESYYLPVPFSIPILSDFLNRFLPKISLLKKLCYIILFECKIE